MKRFTVFHHLSAPKVAEHRRVLEVFARARAGFVIHLRPSEIAGELSVSEDAVDSILIQLHEWGNLDRSHDHIEAASIEEFYRVKWLYQLSKRGEAAERALETFESSLRSPGELQKESLREIVGYLKALQHLLASDKGNSPVLDQGKLFQQFRDLFGRFEEFTVQAQRFMQFLQTTIELHELTEEDFVVYKDRLIDYLRRFIDELITSAAEIGGLLESLERLDVREVLPSIAIRSRADALDADDPDLLERERKMWEGRWLGMRRWFLGDGNGGRSQAETLRARAREAIPSLLVALQSFHDRRESGSDRRRDWAELARWFAEASDDSSAHRLWRVAFGLGAARHLRINNETLSHREQSDEGARTSWLAAEPMWLSPQLRKSGRAPRSSRPAELVDLSRERAHLRQLAAEENEQIVRAREHLITAGPVFLSDFANLDEAAFDLLMEMLGRAVTAAVGCDESGFPVAAQSMDGSLVIELWPAEAGSALARIESENGTLTGPDFRVAIRSVEEAAQNDNGDAA